MIEQTTKRCFKSKEFLVKVIFKKLGFRSDLKSSKYLEKAMLIYIDKPYLRFSNDIYPMVASGYSIKPENLRTLLDSAIKRSWGKCSIETIKEVADHPEFTEEKKIPTVNQFFFLVRIWVLKQMQN